MTHIPTLPNKLYMVRVPDIATYTEAELRIRGKPTTFDHYGNPVLSLDYDNYVTVMLPLTRIIDIYIEGYDIFLVNQKDASDIYNNLTEYLRESTSQNPFSLIQNTKPDRRLYDIEKFVDGMFNKNKVSIVKDNFASPSGFDLGLGNIGYKTPDQVRASKQDGKSKVFNVTNIDMPATGDYNYIFNSVPNIDFDNVKRDPIIKTRYALRKEE